MNKFTLVNKADAEVIKELNGWIEKIAIYLQDFFDREIERVKSTQLGDCISKVNYLFEIALAEPSKFRGVKDELGRLQAGAIIEAYFDYVDVDAIANAPWNVLKNQPETIKGAAISLMEQIIIESKELGFGGCIKLVAIERAKSFYTKIGFTEDEDNLWSLELKSTAAERFLERQRNRRRSENQ